MAAKNFDSDAVSKSGDISDIFHCPLCSEKYNLDERKPKVLDCGHTNCLECLSKWVKQSGGRTCPKCRQTFAEAPFFIKDNYLICPFLESSSNAAAPTPAVALRFYCTQCDADAGDLCLMAGHPLTDKTSMVLRRAEEAKQQAQRQFRREAAMLNEMTAVLDGVKAALAQEDGVLTRVHAELVEFTSSKETLDKAQQLVENVPGTAFQDNDDIPRALDRFLQQNSERLFALEEQKRMLEMAMKCTVTVASEEAGLAWGAKLELADGSPPEERVLVYLIYLLLLNQQQRHADHSPSSQEAGFAPSAPNMSGGGDGEKACWAARPPPTASLDELLSSVKRCVVDGEVPEDDAEEDEDADDDDTDSDTSSMVSDISTLPEACQSSKKVFVGKIPTSARPEEIKELFSKFGKITYVRFLNYSKVKAESGGRVKPKICALVFVPDDVTVENILRNRPIVYQKRGQFDSWLLNVQEDKTQKRQIKSDEKKQRKLKKRGKKNHKGSDGANQSQAQVSNSSTPKSAEESEAARRIFVNQVPLEVTESQLTERFSTYGPVASVMKRRHGVGEKCMAFVTYKDEASVARVLAARPVKFYGTGHEGGYDMQVREFRPKAAAPPAARGAPQGLPPQAAAAPPSQGFHSQQTMAAAAAAAAAAHAAVCVSAQNLQQGPQGPQGAGRGHQGAKPKCNKQPQQPQQAQKGPKSDGKGPQLNTQRGHPQQQQHKQQQQQKQHQQPNRQHQQQISQQRLQQNAGGIWEYVEVGQVAMAQLQQRQQQQQRNKGSSKSKDEPCAIM